MSGNKLTLFGRDNILFMLKRTSRADWSQTKVIYGGFLRFLIGQCRARGRTAEFSCQSYIKNQNIKTC